MLSPSSLRRAGAEDERMRPTTITITSFADVVSVIPALFGFHVSNSLVVIEVHDGRLGFRLRVDMPDDKDHAMCAEIVADHVERNQASAVIVVVLDAHMVSAQPLLYAVAEAALHRDISVLALVHARDAQYWVCEPGSRGFSGPFGYEAEIGATVIEAIAAGVNIHSSRSAHIRDLLPVTGRARAVARNRIVQAWKAIEPNIHDEPKAIATARSLRRRGIDITPIEVAQLCCWLRNPSARDALWLNMDRESAMVDLEFWSRIARTAVTEHDTAVFFLAGFAAWMRGDGALARTAWEHSVALDPQNRATTVLLRALTAGVGPDAWLQLKDQGLLAAKGCAP